MLYNGWQVDPVELRNRAPGFSDHAHDLDVIKKALKEAFDDDAFLGNDQAGNTFRSQAHRPLLDNIYKTLDGCAEGMRGMTDGLQKMATNYEKADHASTVRT